jgi:predicted GNAT family acetyltransferase
MEKHQLINNTRDQSYEFHLDGDVAKIDYMKTKNGEIALTHTEVPYKFQGKGVGRELVEAVLIDIEKNGEKVIPLCGFVIAYIRKNPQWKKLVLEGVNV